MSHDTLQVLLIEDNPGDAALVQELLPTTGDTTFRIHWVEALLPGLERLAQRNIDVILLDLSLPDSQGLDGLNAIRTHAEGVPVVVLTGLASESLALRAVQAGAQDYLVKGTFDSETLARTLRHAVVRHHSRADASKPELSREPGRVVGFLGVKGGVGTTTIACHVAAELKKLTGGRVLLMDLGGGANSIGFLMRAAGPYTILDASNDILRLDETRWEKLVVREPGGLDIIQSAGLAVLEDQQPKSAKARFVVRFVRSLYQWIVIDLGRLCPFSAVMAEEVSSLFLTSTCDVLSLNEAKSVAQKLHDAGLDRLLRLTLNRTPRRMGFSSEELRKILGVAIDATLPDCTRDFETAALDGKALGQSRDFQKHIVGMAARIAGVEENAPAKGPFSFLTGMARHATT